LKIVLAIILGLTIIVDVMNNADPSERLASLKAYEARLSKSISLLQSALSPEGQSMCESLESTLRIVQKEIEGLEAKV
jgi:hypothetical protein